jgi:catechol 2,3-dioxygenase-like lactoylglutathione lyase family enzyme
MQAIRITNFRLFALPKDWKATRDFYAEKLGLTLSSSNDELGVAVFSDGGVTLCIEQVDPADAEEVALVGRWSGLGFRVESAEEACDALERQGVPITGRPTKQAWGGILMHARDPAGNVIDLAEYPPG